MSPISSIILKRSDVPEYLQDSERYQYLSSNNDEISVPSAFLKVNTIILTAHDLEHLLLTMQHWKLYSIPKDATTAALRSQQSFQNLQDYESTDELSYMGLIIIQRGQLECLQFLIQCGMTVDKTLCVHAAACSQLQCLKLLIEAYVQRGGAVTADIWKAAINNDEVSASCLIYLLRAFPLIKRKMDLVNWACRAGRLSCVQVLRDHNCPIDVSAVLAAAEGGSLACLQYLHEEFGFRCWVPALDLSAIAMGYGGNGLGEKELELMQLLHEIGTAWDASALVAALNPRKPHRSQIVTPAAINGCNDTPAPRE